MKEQIRRLQHLLSLISETQSLVPELETSQFINWHSVADGVREVAGEIASLCEQKGS